MKFQAAADLVAALRPFTHPTRSSHLEGFERLVRAASSVTGELQEVKRLMPARAVHSRATGAQAVSLDPSDPDEIARDGDDAGTSVSSEAAGEAASFRGASRLPGRGLTGSPALILLLVLILLLDSR